MNRASAWLTMDSAPRDGKPILAVALPKKSQFIATWDGFDWIDSGLGLREPTHWQPLPEPPAE